MGAHATVRPEGLSTLLDLARASRGRPLGEVLAAVGDAIDRIVGFELVTVNVYRPGFDDYQVRHVHGPERARRELAGLVTDRSGWARVLAAATPVVPGVFLVDRPETWHLLEAPIFTPDGPAAPEPSRSWQQTDGVLLPLQTGDGAPLGILSVDVPRSGQRPPPAEAQLLAVVAEYATVALETHRAHRAAARHERELKDLLGLTDRLGAATTREQALDHLCAALVRDFGYGTAAVFTGASFARETLAGAGAPATLDAVVPGRALALMSRDYAVVPRADLMPTARPSPGAGRGPHAWDDHRVLLTLRRRSGAPFGIVVLDEPDDGLLPDAEQRHVLLLLAQHASAALEVIDRQERLTFLATHDPLTGARNRRDLHSTADGFATAAGGVAAVVCDIDHFKSVNDEFGHDVGDRVLERFGQILADHARATDVVFRLGGEEFCLLLPGADLAAGAAAAERIRRAIPPAFADLLPRLTASFGVASTIGASRDAPRLFAAADRALYAAKRGGRDRVACDTPAVQVTA